MHKILVGCDPELFAFRNGHPISAHGMIKGTKEEPFKVQNGAVQIDGTALEFNIDPAHDAQEFVHNINSVLNQLKAMVPDVDIRAVPVADYGYEYMKTLPLEAVELGCNPDFNAWKDGCVNEKPNADVPFRTASGHVHVGWCEGADVYDAGHYDRCIAAVKQLDYSLGLGSLLFDADVRRRQLYGSAGAFRPKSYGVEYRVLSNAWLRSNGLMQWVYNTTVLSLEKLMEGKRLSDLADRYNLNPVNLLGGVDKIDAGKLIAFMEEAGFEVPPQNMDMAQAA